MRKFLASFRRVTFSFLLFPIALTTFTTPALTKDEIKKTPAQEADLFLYRAIGATYICVAREVDIDFNKAAAIAAITYVNLLEGRHDSKLEGFGDKIFTRKELLFGANNQLIPAAYEYCPDKLPKETKKQVKKFLKEIKNKN